MGNSSPVLFPEAIVAGRQKVKRRDDAGWIATEASLICQLLRRSETSHQPAFGERALRDGRGDHSPTSCERAISAIPPRTHGTAPAWSASPADRTASPTGPPAPRPCCR